MRKVIHALALVALALVTLWSAQVAAQSFVEGYNFRSTSGYVTDGANQTYVVAATAYPTTRDGSTFGWTTNPTNCLNRSTSPDVRLAGICHGDGIGVFRVDLPGPGTYDIRLAMGDYGSGQSNMRVKVWDNSTQKLDIGPYSTLATRWYDANNAGPYDATSWPASNTAVSVTFASAILRVTLEADATTTTALAHLSISGSPDGGGGGGGNPCMRLLGVGLLCGDDTFPWSLY